MGSRYLELVVSDKKANPDNSGADDKKWFVDWYKVVNIPSKTAYRMWDEFATATGLGITPSKASVEQQKAFAAWHLEQSEQKKRDDEKRKQQSEEEAAKAKTQREFDAWMEKIEVIVKWLKETPVVDAKLLLLAALDES